MSETSAQGVDLVINVFERTWRRALEPSRFAEIRATNPYPFARVVLLVNNVQDPGEARSRGESLLQGELIDEFHFVADHLERALQIVGLTRADLEPLLHYSDGPLVAATLPGRPWFLYWDAEALLRPAHDWISPALALMSEDPRVLAANPSWEMPSPDGRRAGLERETIETHGEFALGAAFSDQVFLAERAALARPIYSQRCISRITYPGAHKAHVFEARIAAHMRHHARLRATSLQASYITETPSGGSSYPPRGARETARFLRNALLLRALSLSPWRPRCLRHTWL